MWNIMYEGVFGLHVPEEAMLIRFADVLAAVVIIVKHSRRWNFIEAKALMPSKHGYEWLNWT